MIRLPLTLCFDTFVFRGIILSLCILQRKHFTRPTQEQETATLIKETVKGVSQNGSHLDFKWRKLLMHFITMYANLWKEGWIGILIPINLLKWIQFFSCISRETMCFKQGNSIIVPITKYAMIQYALLWDKEDAIFLIIGIWV